MLSTGLVKRKLQLQREMVKTIETRYSISIARGLNRGLLAKTNFKTISTVYSIARGYTSMNAMVRAKLFRCQVQSIESRLALRTYCIYVCCTSKYIGLWFKNLGHETWFCWYATVCIFISLLIYFTMKHTKHTSLVTE